MYINLLGKPTDANLDKYSQVPMNGTHLPWATPTLSQLATPTQFSHILVALMTWIKT